MIPFWESLYLSLGKRIGIAGGNVLEDAMKENDIGSAEKISFIRK